MVTISAVPRTQAVEKKWPFRAMHIVDTSLISDIQSERKQPDWFPRKQRSYRWWK
jgi:hypothetical protein